MHEIIDNLFLGPFSAIGHAIPKEGTGNRPPLSHHQGFSRFLQGGGSSCRLPAPEQIKHQFYCWRLRWREQVSDLDMSRLPGPDDWEIPPQSGQRGRMPRFWSFHWDKVAPPSNGWLVYEWLDNYCWCCTSYYPNRQWWIQGREIPTTSWACLINQHEGGGYLVGEIRPIITPTLLCSALPYSRVPWALHTLTGRTIAHLSSCQGSSQHPRKIQLVASVSDNQMLVPRSSFRNMWSSIHETMGRAIDKEVVLPAP